jgi:hypothetical protein
MVTGTNELLSITRDRLNSVMDQAVQWGADQELEACCQFLRSDLLSDGTVEHLRAVRRPKPPSLKEQALKQLRDMDQAGALDCNTDKIRAALEALND